MENQFKKGDKVLVRNTKDEEWHFGFYFNFANEAKFKHNVFTQNDTYFHCIPYDGNEELVGTKNSPNENKETKGKFSPGQQLYDAEIDETVIFVGYNSDGTVKTASLDVAYRDCSPDVLSED